MPLFFTSSTQSTHSTPPPHRREQEPPTPSSFVSPIMQPAVAVVALLLLPPLSTLLRLPIATADSNGTGGGDTSCAPARCGNVSIAYPFSLLGVQPLYCGFPSLQLTCFANRTYLSWTFRERLYNVLDIFYGNSSLVVAVEATFAGDDGCRVPDFNVSSGLALLPVNISYSNKNLTFIYSCDVPPKLRLQSSACANHTAMGAYTSDDAEAVHQLGSKNCSSVSVPVRWIDRDMEPARLGYEELIKEGFLLEWPQTSTEECDQCLERGGECRFVGVSFQCICCQNSHDRRGNHKLILKVTTLCSTASLIITCLVWIMYHRKRKRKHVTSNQKYKSNNKPNIEEILKGYDSLVPRRYKYSELKKITGSFKDKLGEGGYGMVFKGNLGDGRKVAVKLLKGSKGNGEEFVNEVVSIRRTSHVNIVNLLGFCLHGSKRALIYEYMANGSLEKYIYLEETIRAVGWEKLLEIATGIARGLEYLHRGCNARIIHFDIKPNNILLDEDFCPKISDFGLAKLCHLKDSALSMAEARGTIGFIAPEVFSRGFGVVSTKSDVYSYGMMLLEMVGGRKNLTEDTEDSSQAYFPNWVYNSLVKDLQNHEVTFETEEIARRMTLVGLWCIQTAPGNRPSMSRVIEMLEKNVNELEMPPKPFLSCPTAPSHFSS